MAARTRTCCPTRAEVAPTPETRNVGAPAERSGRLVRLRLTLAPLLLSAWIEPSITSWLLSTDATTLWDPTPSSVVLTRNVRVVEAPTPRPPSTRDSLRVWKAGET